MDTSTLKKISEFEWEIPQKARANVPARIFGTEKLVREMDEQVRVQLQNVTFLPGIQKYAIALCDAHWGYGFPIGGVAAMDPKKGGMVTMGGIGFDISCGVRTMRTGLTINEVRPRLPQLVETLFQNVPAGLGVPGKLRVSFDTLDRILVEGAHWAVKNGFGQKQDLLAIEDGGRVGGADPKNASPTAKKRQLNKMGTLGSGNHYVEVQIVDKVYDEKVAKDWGLKKDDIVVTFHCGSRALGHQIGTDYLKSLAETVQKYKIQIPDRELVCAPIESPEGQKYISAVFAGINCALCNRQIIAHLIRQSVKKVFPEAKVSTLYDVSHNTAKFEEGLLVHRKGATRAFKDQPVIIGGSMGTASFLLVGTGDKRTFSSCIHGAGRTMSRKAAKRKWWGANVVSDLAKKGIVVKTHSMPGVAEEAPGAYKDIEAIVDAVDKIGLSKKVVRLKPLGCVKG